MKDFTTKSMMLGTHYMVLLAVLAVTSIGTVYAANEYDATWFGDYHIKGDLIVDGDITGQTIQEFATGTVVITSSTTTTDAIYDLEDRISKIERHLNMTNTDS